MKTLEDINLDILYDIKEQYLNVDTEKLTFDYYNQICNEISKQFKTLVEKYSKDTDFELEDFSGEEIMEMLMSDYCSLCNEDVKEQLENEYGETY